MEPDANRRVSAPDRRVRDQRAGQLAGPDRAVGVGAGPDPQSGGGRRGDDRRPVPAVAGRALDGGSARAAHGARAPSSADRRGTHLRRADGGGAHRIVRPCAGGNRARWPARAHGPRAAQSLDRWRHRTRRAVAGGQQHPHVRVHRLHGHGPGGGGDHHRTLVCFGCPGAGCALVHAGSGRTRASRPFPTARCNDRGAEGSDARGAHLRAPSPLAEAPSVGVHGPQFRVRRHPAARGRPCHPHAAGRPRRVRHRAGPVGCRRRPGQRPAAPGTPPATDPALCDLVRAHGRRLHGDGPGPQCGDRVCVLVPGRDRERRGGIRDDDRHPGAGRRRNAGARRRPERITHLGGMWSRVRGRRCGRRRRIGASRLCRLGVGHPAGDAHDAPRDAPQPIWS